MTVLTVKNHGWYSDFKPLPNNAIVWLPLFNYVCGFFMMITGNYSITIARLVNVFAGAFTCIIVYGICLRLYNHEWFATIGGLTLALQPWHIDYSTLGTTETLTGFFASLMIFSFLTGRKRLFYIFSSLAMLTGYEGWFIAIFLVSVGFLRKGWKGRDLASSVGTVAAVISAWSFWSYVNVGYPLSWITAQAAMAGWRLHFAPAHELLFYVNLILVMTFFLFVIGVTAGMLHSRNARTLSFLILAYITFYTVARFIGLDYGDPGRLIILLPAVFMVVPSAFPKFNGRKTRALLVLALISILLVPYFAPPDVGIRTFQKKVYVVKPQYRTGLAFEKVYVGGTVLCDFPTVIYYSGLDVNRFISYEHLDWYIQTRDSAKLESWLKENNVTFIVWQNVVYSKCGKVFEGFDDGQTHTIGSIRFTCIYEDSLRIYNLLGIYEEHAAEVPDIFIYKVDYL
jgi:hypothetical protein